MRGHLLCRLQNLRRQDVHHAVQLVQLPELFVDLQFFQNALLGRCVQLLLHRRILSGQRLIRGIVLLELCPQSLRAGVELVQQRFQLVQLGLLVERIGVVQDVSVPFTSPSSAAMFVLGGSTNGWIEWKNRDGKTLDELFRR